MRRYSLYIWSSPFFKETSAKGERLYITYSTLSSEVAKSHVNFTFIYIFWLIWICCLFGVRIKAGP